jgi:hypothetical protein
MSASIRAAGLVAVVPAECGEGPAAA